MTDRRIPMVDLVGRTIVSAQAYLHDYALDDEFHRIEIRLDDGRTIHIDCWTDMAGGDAGISVSQEIPVTDDGEVYAATGLDDHETLT